MQINHTKNMRAAIVSRYGGPEVLELTELEIPTPNARQVLIRVHAASVNFADINARKGMYHLGKKPPFIPGIDCAGVVAAVGASVTNIDVNQKVVAFPASGSYAEFALAEENLVFPIPETLSYDLAAAGKIEMQIAKRIPLKNVQRAHRLLENQEVIGKLILVED